MSYNLLENNKIVLIEGAKDWTGAALTTEYVNMKYADKLYFIIQLGTMTSTSNQAVTLNVGNDASGTKSASLGSSTTLCRPHFLVRASGDTLTITTVASSTFNITKSDDNKTFVIEVDKRNMGTLTSTSVYSATHVALGIATPGAHACLRSIIAILTGYRYQEDSPPTAIT